MKAVLRLLLIVAVLGTGIWCLLTFLNEREEREWQTLSGRGQVRIAAITQGPIHRLQPPGPPFSKRIYEAFRLRSLAPLRMGPQFGGIATIPSPGLGIWLELRGIRQVIPSSKMTMRLSDEREFQCSMSGGSINDYIYQCAVFSYVPAREKTLHLTCNIDGRDLEFTVKNPAYRSDLPVWKGAPLPQTQTNGDLALTLRSVAIQKGEVFTGGGRKPGRRARLGWTATKAGANADKWYNLEVRFDDPSGQGLRDCGLFNEPVWKVHCTAIRNERYPFQDEEVEWFGTINPEAPEEKTYQLFSVAKAGRTDLQLAGVFGPGQYTILDGAVISAAQKTEPRTNPPVHFNFQSRGIDIALDKPSFVLIGSPFMIYRDMQGRPAALENEWVAGGFTMVHLRPLPKTPIRFGTVDRGASEFDFLIPTPDLPGLKKPLAKQ